MLLPIGLVDSQLSRLPRRLAVEWPGGKLGSQAPEVCVKLRRPELLALVAGGRIGELGEAYVRGDLDIEGSMPDLMSVAGAMAGDPRDPCTPARWTGWLQKWRSQWRHRRQRDAEQVRKHYDVSDAFYALWLDPLMVYSCAYYGDRGMSLEGAQQAKLDLICRKLQLAPGQRFLDVGCGWGSLLVWAAARYGVHGLGITLSHNQHDHVRRLIVDAGVSGQVSVKLLDYRDLPVEAQFDRIASVGMFEHVGRARLPEYFGRLRRLLRPGGLLLNHGIAAGGLDNAQLGAGMGDFIERHIFPGGELVHVAHATQALARGGLELLDAENLRPHYARTLWDWSARLEAQLATARALTSEATVRAYRLYLAGSAMCFERGWLSLYQLLASRPEATPNPSRAWAAQSDYPFTRRHMHL